MNCEPTQKSESGSRLDFMLTHATVADCSDMWGGTYQFITEMLIVMIIPSGSAAGRLVPSSYHYGAYGKAGASSAAQQPQQPREQQQRCATSAPSGAAMQKERAAGFAAILASIAPRPACPPPQQPTGAGDPRPVGARPTLRPPAGGGQHPRVPPLKNPSASEKGARP